MTGTVCFSSFSMFGATSVMCASAWYIPMAGPGLKLHDEEVPRDGARPSESAARSSRCAALSNVLAGSMLRVSPNSYGLGAAVVSTPVAGSGVSWRP